MFNLPKNKTNFPLIFNFFLNELFLIFLKNKLSTPFGIITGFLILYFLKNSNSHGVIAIILLDRLTVYLLNVG